MTAGSACFALLASGGCCAVLSDGSDCWNDAGLGDDGRGQRRASLRGELELCGTVRGGGYGCE